MIEKEKIVYGRKIDWSGIMAGTVVSFSLLFLFYLLGVGVGILENQSWSESPFLTGSDGRVWGWISFGVSILLGGIVAARFSGEIGRASCRERVLCLVVEVVGWRT